MSSDFTSLIIDENNNTVLDKVRSYVITYKVRSYVITYKVRSRLHHIRDPVMFY